MKQGSAHAGLGKTSLNARIGTALLWIGAASPIRSEAPADGGRKPRSMNERMPCEQRQ